MTIQANIRTPPTGVQLVELLAALSNPHRLRIVAALHGGRNYVSQLARYSYR